MSVYREPAKRTARAAAIAGALGVLVGGVAGLLLGRASVEEPSLGERIGEVQGEIRPALSALELVEIEYSEAVRGGRVVAKTEYEAAESQAETAAATFEGVSEDLDLLAPQETRDAERRLSEVQRLIGQRVEPRAVKRATREATSSLEIAAGLE